MLNDRVKGLLVKELFVAVKTLQCLMKDNKAEVNTVVLFALHNDSQEIEFNISSLIPQGLSQVQMNRFKGAIQKINQRGNGDIEELGAGVTTEDISDYSRDCLYRITQTEYLEDTQASSPTSNFGKIRQGIDQFALGAKDIIDAADHWYNEPRACASRLKSNFNSIENAKNTLFQFGLFANKNRIRTLTSLGLTYAIGCGVGSAASSLSNVTGVSAAATSATQVAIESMPVVALPVAANAAISNAAMLSSNVATYFTTVGEILAPLMPQITINMDICIAAMSKLRTSGVLLTAASTGEQARLAREYLEFFVKPTPQPSEEVILTAALNRV